MYIINRKSPRFQKIPAHSSGKTSSFGTIIGGGFSAVLSCGSASVTAEAGMSAVPDSLPPVSSNIAAAMIMMM
jgi:hypothetical protein